MVSKHYAISTLFAIAGLLSMLAIGGLKGGGADAAVSDSHYHSYSGSTLAHGHNHDGFRGAGRVVVSDEGGCGHIVGSLHLPNDPNHCCICCHEDHSHHASVFALTVTGPRWDEQIPSSSCPLPALWQREPMYLSVIRPMPPPLDSPGDPISQLRTVVMLT